MWLLGPDPGGPDGGGGAGEGAPGVSRGPRQQEQGRGPARQAHHNGGGPTEKSHRQVGVHSTAFSVRKGCTLGQHTCMSTVEGSETEHVAVMFVGVEVVV